MMDERCKAKFRIKAYPYGKDQWSVCCGLSHSFDETYIYLNLFKWSVSIGWQWD